MPPDISSAIRQTQRYWYDDGLAEIAAGAVFLAISLLFAVEARLPADSPINALSALGLPVVVLLGSWLAGRAVRLAKERITYPRTGYVRYRRTSRKRGVGVALVAAGVAALLVLWMARFGAPDRMWIPAMDGLAVGAMLLYLGYTFDLRRYLGLAAVSVACGFLISLRVPDEIAGSAWFFGVMGVALIAVGATVLWRYLRHTTPADTASPEIEAAPAPEVGR